MKTVLETLKTFDESTLPDLDVVVLGALEMFVDTTLPSIDINEYKRPLVVGSVNALSTGMILFEGTDAVFADESQYQQKISHVDSIDGAYVISASGSKHATGIVKKLLESNIPVTLITNTSNAPAATGLVAESVRVYPKNREPYTYNTSTYLSMILGNTKENAKDIQEYIEKTVSPKILRNFENYGAFVLLIPPEFAHIRAMLRTKFDELFGPYITGRVFTSEEVKHAKTVVTSGDELFISFGFTNTDYGLPKNRIEIPLPSDVQYGAIIAITYYVMGIVQKQHPQHFKNAIVAYTEEASALFNTTLNTIVE